MTPIKRYLTMQATDGPDGAVLNHEDGSPMCGTAVVEKSDTGELTLSMTSDGTTETFQMVPLDVIHHVVPSKA